MTGRTTLLVFTVAACAAAHGQAAPAGPPRTAFAVPRGGPRPLLTEVWTVNPDGSGGRRVRTYPGEPGDLLSLPGRGELVYLERSLRHAVFGAHLCGGRHLPLAGNRVWRLREDGSGETPWPLPDGLQPLGIAVSPDGERLTVRGHTGPDRGEEGVWVVDRGGNATRLPGDPSPPGDASPYDPPPPHGDESPGYPSHAIPSGLSQDPALAPAGSALDACVTGYHAMHRGDRHAERRAWESAIRASRPLRRRRAFPGGAVSATFRRSARGSTGPWRNGRWTSAGTI